MKHTPHQGMGTNTASAASAADDRRMDPGGPTNNEEAAGLCVPQRKCFFNAREMNQAVSVIWPPS